MTQDRPPESGTSKSPSPAPNLLGQPLADTPRTFWVELIGVLALVGGFGGYAVYLFVTEPPLNSSLAPASPSPTASPTPIPTPTPAFPPSPSANDKPLPKIYQMAPKVGVFYPDSPVLGASRRTIVHNDAGRFCIQMTNAELPGTVAQTETLVSSLVIDNRGIVVEATGEVLEFDNTMTAMRDRLGTWQLLEPRPELSAALTDCLASTEPFARTLTTN